MDIKTLLLALLGAILWMTNTASVADEGKVYKTVDENGKVIFSDKPSANSTEVDTTPNYVYETLKPASPTKTEIVPQKSRSNDYQLDISSPAEGQRFSHGQRTLTISASVTPELADDHYLMFYFNGIPIGQPSKSSSASVPLGIKVRGQRSTQVAIVDKRGNTIKQGPRRMIMVIR